MGPQFGLPCFCRPRSLGTCLHGIWHTQGMYLNPPNVPKLRALWSRLDGIWGLLKGSRAVLGNQARGQWFAL